MLGGRCRISSINSIFQLVMCCISKRKPIWMTLESEFKLKQARRHPVRRPAILLPFEVDVMRPIVSGVLQENDQARYGKDLVTSGVSSKEVDILRCVVVLLRCSAIHLVMHLIEQSMYIYKLLVCILILIAITFFGILIFLWALFTVSIFPGWSQGGWWYRATFMLLRTSTGDGKLNTQY